jgi:hypothetical protein
MASKSLTLARGYLQFLEQWSIADVVGARLQPEYKNLPTEVGHVLSLSRWVPSAAVTE